VILLLDMGNSSLKWASCDGVDDRYVLSDMSRCSWNDAGVEEIAVSQWSTLQVPDRILISSVASTSRNEEIAAWMRSAWGVEPEFPKAHAQACGLENAYADPERLGIDRWAAIIAARKHFSGPLCVVDCGTAITIDVVSAEGRHLGGVIVPGLVLMRQALMEHTNIQLGDVCEISQDQALLTTDTRAAVMGGTLYSAVAIIDRVVADTKGAMGSVPICVITGGDAEKMFPMLVTEYRYIPDLVLQGLAYLAGDVE
jgi:type III pantothenate kinase